LQQQLHDRVAAVARGQHQRRAAVGRGGIDVGGVFEQQRDDLRVLRCAARDRVMQRRPAGLVHVGAACEQGLHGRQVALDGREHERRFTARVVRIHVHLGRLQQREKDPVGFELQRQQQALVAVRVGRVGVEAAAQQVADGGGVVANDGREEVIVRASLRPCLHRKK